MATELDDDPEVQARLRTMRRYLDAEYATRVMAELLEACSLQVTGDAEADARIARMLLESWG